MATHSPASRLSRLVGMTALAFVGGFSLPAFAQDAPASMDRQQVEQIVRDYLLANPDILIEMSQRLEQQSQQQAQSALFDDPNDGYLGNPDGQTVVVEFFDYNCPYCRSSFDEVQRLVDRNPDAKVILKELPILGPDSEEAHFVSTAVRLTAPEQYQRFHNQMRQIEGRAGRENALAAAEAIGLDRGAIETAMQSEAVRSEIESTMQLANQLRVGGTPTYYDRDGSFGLAELPAKLAPDNG